VAQRHFVFYMFNECVSRSLYRVGDDDMDLVLFE